MSAVKETLIGELKEKCRGMLNDVLAAVEETGESGRFTLTCGVSMKDVETRRIVVKVGGSVTLGQSSKETEAALVEDLQLELFPQAEAGDQPPTPEEESGEAAVENEEDDGEEDTEADSEAEAEMEEASA